MHRADGRVPRPARPNGLYQALAGFVYRPSRPWRATPPVWVAVQDPHDGARAEATDLLNACDTQPGYSGFIHPVIAAATAALRRSHPALATSRHSGAEACPLPTRIALS
jgi:hypothetical protein